MLAKLKWTPERVYSEELLTPRANASTEALSPISLACGGDPSLLVNSLRRSGGYWDASRA